MPNLYRCQVCGRHYSTKGRKVYTQSHNHNNKVCQCKQETRWADNFNEPWRIDVFVLYKEKWVGKK